MNIFGIKRIWCLEDDLLVVKVLNNSTLSLSVKRSGRQLSNVWFSISIINTLRPRQNGRHFTDNTIVKVVCLNIDT